MLPFTISVLLTSVYIQFLACMLQIDQLDLKNYHLTSSRVHSVNRFKKRDNSLIHSPKEFTFTINLSEDPTPLTAMIKERNCDIFVNSSSTELYEGFLAEVPHNSSVSGYIKEQNFYGHIILNNTLYYVDELREGHQRVDLPEGQATSPNALVFKRDSAIMGIFVTETDSAKSLFEDLIKKKYYNRKYRNWKRNGMLCPLVVVIDYSFLTLVHRGNADAATFHVLFSLEEANSIFRITDFDEDGEPDNIGFYVKKLVIIRDDQQVDFLPKYNPGTLRITDYLVQFMKYEELKNHCLGIAFTAQKFEKNALGASYTPDSTSLFPTSGVCEPHITGFGTLNGLVITASTIKTPLVNQIIFEVTIAHELGHSFGSAHDSTAKCLGYIMAPKSFQDYNSNRSHLMFSRCSREHIIRTLTTKGGCFEPVNTPFCGNGIVENGEDCDCGLTRDCLLRDPCCVPRRTQGMPCKTNKKIGHQCHPSQGVCCTDSCKYNMNPHFLYGCKNFDKTCPCSKSEGPNCTCGINGQCSGDECHSLECTRLRLKECQCNTNFVTTKTCQICCQTDPRHCVPAVQVHKRAARLLRGRNYSGTQKNQWNFLQAQLGGHCLSMGKLGLCRPNLQCQVLRARQTFPSFKNTSTIFPVNFLNAICYFFFNVFLIYLFY
ncbi:disintegrin and metalloproteinase domain-containing protein 10-like [Euwallacea fornicatus]|uniref:disintegrin and metalloproteinase domain-containing protein 10-like n=1 Tax=Euwallacea fornicatus TaxID=995702 RepID=UPI0033903EC5